MDITRSCSSCFTQSECKPLGELHGVCWADHFHSGWHDTCISNCTVAEVPWTSRPSEDECVLVFSLLGLSGKNLLLWPLRRAMWGRRHNLSFFEEWRGCSEDWHVDSKPVLVIGRPLCEFHVSAARGTLTTVTCCVLTRIRSTLVRVGWWSLDGICKPSALRCL